MTIFNKGTNFVSSNKYFTFCILYFFQRLLICSYLVASFPLVFMPDESHFVSLYGTLEVVPVLKIISVILFHGIFQNTVTKGEKLSLAVSLSSVA